MQYPDGYIQIKDRSKDIIISGRREHRPSRWKTCSIAYRRAGRCRGGQARSQVGETPCAFLEIKPGANVTEEGHHCPLQAESGRSPSARRHIVFGECPKTSTGKIQKFELRKQIGSSSAIVAG